MRPARALRNRALCALLACLAACKSSPFGKVSVDSLEEVPAAVVEARALVEAGNPTRAMDLLHAAREVQDLSTDDRIQIETLLEQVAQARITELSSDPEGTKELSAIVDLGLPSQIAVRAGVAAARLYLDAGRPYRAYRTLVDLETRYPSHPERRAAGTITAAAGLGMAAEKARFLGFFTLHDEGVEALEWLVVTYPSEARCDEAYYELGEIYAADRDFRLSVQRYEDLIAYDLRSPLSIEAQARVPRMRLAGLESPEYDRRELLRARDELENWLRRHAGLPEEEQVRRDYGDCLTRMVLSDQGIAKFYARVDKPFGALLHAQRALDTARLIGDADLVASCEALLAKTQALAAKVAREGESAGFLDRPDAEVKPSESIAVPPAREAEDAKP